MKCIFYPSFFVGFCFFATGCVTARPAIERVRFHMWPAQVIAELGEPDRVEPDPADPRTEHWIYSLEGAKCRVTFHAQLVTERPPCQTEARLEELQELELYRDPGLKVRQREEKRRAKLRNPEEAASSQSVYPQ